MESHDIVAIAAIGAGTAIGVVEICVNHDGAILTGMISLYALILGYVFGRGTTLAESVAADKLARESAAESSSKA